MTPALKDSFGTPLPPVTTFLDDPLRVRFEKLAGKQYVFTLSDAVPGGIYGALATQRTYAHLLGQAGLLLGCGWPVIVDAANLK